MAAFKTLLEILASGTASVDFVKDSVDEVILSGAEDPNDMLAQIDVAVGEGLPTAAADALRKQIRKYAAGGAPATGLELASTEAPAASAPPPPAASEPKLDMDLELVPLDPEEEARAQASAASEQKTVVVPGNRPGAAADKTLVANDRTVAMPADKTQVASADAKTVMTTGRQDDRTVRTDSPVAGGGDYDPFAVDSQRTSPPTGQQTTGGSWPTGTAWPGAGGGKPLEIGPGTVLKDRFELISPLGEGGMGVVYKARDLLKVEAKDRNPYIAVKLLTGDFRNHPESFIALQRESSKAQRLAHPNIATVYDFDRDRGTVYMTMEILEGQELAKYIKKLPAGGLPPDDALKVTKQLCDGLSYAHQRGLVHSDFKPGNCFYLNDGTVKIMDFGIARASKTRKDVQGETTVFDPGQLGALTPAYATVEMFEGQDPAPADDIYALAVTCYELLTGKHPFNKLSAVKVLEKGLTPAPITKPNWTKRQNRSLMKALALKREQRTASVEEFWEGIRPKKDYTLQIAAGAVVGVLLLGAGVYSPIKQYFEDKRNAQIIANVVQGGDAAIPDTLAQVDTLDERSRRAILENQESKDKILAYFQNLAQAEIDPATAKYNYGKAFAVLDAAKKYYPDSAQLASISRDMEEERNKLVSQLNGEFDQFLTNRQLLPNPQEREMTDVLAEFKAVAPKHDVFADVRVTKEYGALVQQSMRGGDFKRADEILDLTLGYYPTDATLRGLRDQVDRELKRQADAQLVADIKQRLNEKRGTLQSLDDYASVRADLLKLNELRPEDTLLGELAQAVRGVLDAALAQRIAAKQWAEAEQALFDYAQLVPVPDLLKKREDLSRAELGAGWQPANLSDVIGQLDKRQAAIRGLLAKPAFDAEWDAQLLANFRETIALLRPGNTWFDSLRKEIVDAHLTRATTLIGENRFDAAVQAIAAGERFQPGLDRFGQARDALTAAKQRFEAELAEKERVAAITQMKNSLLAQAGANEVARAKASFENLRSQLGASDEWVRGEGTRAMGGMYKNLADKAMERNDAAAAEQALREGMQVAPDMKELRDAMGAIANAAKRQSAYRRAETANSNNIRELPGLLNAARQALPQEANTIQAETMKRLAAQIKSVEGRDVAEANAIWEAAKELFPGERALTGLSLRAPPRPSVFAPRVRDQIAAGKLTEAQRLLDEGKRSEPGHESLAAADQELQKARNEANALFTQYMTAMRAGNRTGAKPYLDQALKQWSDSPQFIAEQQKNFQVTTAPTRAADGSRACSASLAGHGRQGRAECFDMPNGQKGPALVVVPAGGGFPQPFAIGKYEVSVAEYNAVCNATSRCPRVAGEPNMPATGLSLDAARSFATALAEITGKSYRLPNEQEWSYAAAAGNPGAVKDFNCRVQQGDQILKGITMLDVRTGVANPWGLVNYVGNAQEFVLKGTGAVLRGGAYTDSLSNCGIELAKATGGSADPLAGFRVIRDIDP